MDSRRSRSRPWLRCNTKQFDGRTNETSGSKIDAKHQVPGRQVVHRVLFDWLIAKTPKGVPTRNGAHRHLWYTIQTTTLHWACSEVNSPFLQHCNWSLCTPWCPRRPPVRSPQCSRSWSRLCRSTQASRTGHSYISLSRPHRSECTHRDSRRSRSTPCLRCISAFRNGSTKKHKKYIAVNEYETNQYIGSVAILLDPYRVNLCVAERRLQT